MKDKKELSEVRFDATVINLRDNLVRGAILPGRIAELGRIVIFEGNVTVEGAIYGQRIEFRQGDAEINGSVFAKNELHIDSDARGDIIFKKTVGSAGTVASRAPGCSPVFCSDINGKSVTLRGAYVAGSIYADDITLENCVVIGGVFATQEAVIENSIIGTFNTPRVTLSGTVQLLLPSAFTIEQPTVAPGTRLFNLALADLGDLYKGLPQDAHSGRIPMNLETDEVRAQLSDGEKQQPLRSFTVIGKVLAADMADIDRFQNHFLLTAASLGPQLLRTYDLGSASDGQPATLDALSIRDFFFKLLSGRIEPQDMSATFSLLDVANQ